MNEIPYQSIGKIYNTTHLHELLFMLRSMIGALQNNDVRLKNNSNLHTQMECFCNCTKVGDDGARSTDKKKDLRRFAEYA